MKQQQPQDKSRRATARDALLPLVVVLLGYAMLVILSHVPLVPDLAWIVRIA